MNNSQLNFEEVVLEESSIVDVLPVMRQEATQLASIIEAIDNICQSDYWQTLEKLIFKEVLEVLQRKIRSEKEPTEVFRLQGQIVWAEKYADLRKMSDIYRQRLEQIKRQIQNGEQ